MVPGAIEAKGNVIEEASFFESLGWCLSNCTLQLLCEVCSVGKEVGSPEGRIQMWVGGDGLLGDFLSCKVSPVQLIFE